MPLSGSGGGGMCGRFIRVTVVKYELSRLCHVDGQTIHCIVRLVGMYYLLLQRGY